MLFPFHDDTPTTRFPVVTVTIIAINVVVFLFTLTLEPLRYHEFIAENGFIPARLKQLTNPALVVEVPIASEQIRVRRGPLILQGNKPILYPMEANRREILRSLISSLFLHGGIDHIVGNMWFFWIFGNNIEDRLGRIRFLAFYLAAGIFASLCHALSPPGLDKVVPVIGASGAVAATLGAYAVLYPHARIRSLVFLVFFFTVVELPALAVLGFWFAGQLVQAFGMLQNMNLNGGVAFWAHVGGFVAGAAVIRFIAQPANIEFVPASQVTGYSPPDDHREVRW